MQADKAESSSESIVIRVRLQNEYRFLILDVDSFSLDGVMCAVQNIFKINGDLHVNVSLKDNLQTPIPPNDFCTIVNNYRKSSSFYVQLEYNIVQQNPTNVSVEALKQYLIDNDGSSLLRELEKNGILTDISRKKLVNKVTQMCVDIFGVNPTKNQRCMMASAVKTLFPCLETESLVNPNGGYIDNRLKYIRTQMKLTSGQRPEVDVNIEGAVDGLRTISLDSFRSDSLDDSDTIARNIIQSLKGVVVNEQSIGFIKTKLAETTEYRLKMLQNKEIDLRTEFPYFYTNPELILYDFELRYPNVNSCAFKDFWMSGGSNLRKILEQYYNTCVLSTAWPTEIENFFILPKLLAAKNKSSVEVFPKVIDKLITFKMVGSPLEELKVKTNTHPQIIAYGLSRAEILHSYIQIEQELIDVPSDYGILETIDLLFKVHYDFEIDFEPNLAPTLHFLRHFVYKISDTKFKPSNRMLDI